MLVLHTVAELLANLQMVELHSQTPETNLQKAGLHSRTSKADLEKAEHGRPPKAGLHKAEFCGWSPDGQDA